MFPQVRTNLVFGGGDKAEADAVADCASASANGKRGNIKERVEVAGVTTEFLQALFAPC